jgi:Tfp pilus assembly protein PilO
VAAGGVVIVVLALVVLVLPRSRQVSNTQEELDAAQSEELSLRSQLGALQDAEASAPETARQIAALDEQVPANADLASLVLMLQAAADRATVDFFSFAPGAPVADASGNFSVIASSITVTGTYFSLDEFLFLVETLPRAAKVTAVSVASGSSSDTTGGTATATTASTGELQLQMTVEFYTTDTNAGPGSVPGSSGDAATGATGAAPPPATGATSGSGTA